MLSDTFGPDFEDELRSLIGADRKLEAIKRYREQTGASQANAEYVVEALRLNPELAKEVRALLK